MASPVRMEMLKLISVPNITYSVSFLSWSFCNSPNLNIDLAANKKPIAANWFKRMKVKISILSK